MEILASDRQKGVLIVSLNGRLDVTSAPQFENQLNNWLDRGEVNLIIDLGGLTYISSAGLRTLLVAAKQTQARGGGTRLSGARNVVQKVLKISGFDALISSYDSIDAAIAES